MSAKTRITLNKNGIRQVGTLPISVPRNDRRIQANPGDIVIENGKLVIFLGDADVSCTKLGHMSGYSETQIKNMLAPGSLAMELMEC